MAVKQTGLSRELLSHPGETLREAIEDREMNQKELALRTDFTEKHISNVLNGKSPITSKFAMALETALGIDAVFWMNLQANYDIELASLRQPDTVAPDEIAVSRDLRSFIRYWQKTDVLTASNDKKENVLRLRSILGVGNLTVIPDLRIAAAFRVSGSKVLNPYVMYAWVKLCEMTVAKQTAARQLDKGALQDHIQAIKRLMFGDAETLREELTRILAECGIKFSVVPSFRGAPAQGFIGRNSDNEMILCMTIRQKFADIFWFSLFHEIGHIIRDDVSMRFIDYAGASDEREKRADEFAQNILISPEEYKNFVKEGDLSLRRIKDFAQAVNVPPFIVIGRLHKEKLIPYSKFHSEKTKYEWL
jgi:HTH-type transcriptional regulator/antitoxin HigA